ncbi:MAG: hypothetical protein IJD91_09830 [Clostridia bacterium]|nr:hypothetical protein [Clostridia bacterium]
MEPILKEKEVIYDEGYGHRGGNVRGRADAGLALGIVGTVLGGAALLGRGGLGAILGGIPSVTNNYSGGGCVAPTAYDVASKECADILAVTKGYYDLAISGLKSAAATREVDVAEKFGLYKDNRDNIDSVNNRINAELFSLYKYTRDKDDETKDKISALESQVAVNTAVRPYQDKLIMCEIGEKFSWLKNYIDARLCKVPTGVVVLPTDNPVTGIASYCCGNRVAADAATPGA